MQPPKKIPSLILSPYCPGMCEGKTLPMPFQGRRGTQRAQAQTRCHYHFLQEFFLALEGTGLTGTKNSWPSWQNPTEVIGGMTLPWVSSTAGLGKKNKCLPVLRASDSSLASMELHLGHFQVGRVVPFPSLHCII